MKPQNRKEVLLDAIANGKAPDLNPETREEAYLKKIAEKAAEGGGGGANEPIILYYGNGYTSLTATQIQDAVLAGKTVYYCHANSLEDGQLCVLSVILPNPKTAVFCEVGVFTRCHWIDDNGKITSYAYDLSTLQK